MKKIFYLFLILSSCYNPDEYNFTNEDVIKNVILSKETLLANNLDTLTITIELPANTPENTKVKVSCNHGRFVGADGKTTTIDTESRDSPYAETKYISSTNTEDLIITVEVGEYKIEKTLTMINNPPSDLDITSDSIGIHNTGNALLELAVKYKSPNGKVSIGNFSTMTIQDLSGESIGTLYSNEGFSDENGSCKFVYSLLPHLEATGPLIAIGSIKNDANEIIPCDTLTFYIFE